LLSEPRAQAAQHFPLDDKLAERLVLQHELPVVQPRDAPLDHVRFSASAGAYPEAHLRVVRFPCRRRGLAEIDAAHLAPASGPLGRAEMHLDLPIIGAAHAAEDLVPRKEPKLILARIAGEVWLPWHRARETETCEQNLAVSFGRVTGEANGT
jgi:hypothetical protein